MPATRRGRLTTTLVDESKYPVPGQFTGVKACICRFPDCERFRLDHMLGDSTVALPDYRSDLYDDDVADKRLRKALKFLGYDDKSQQDAVITRMQAGENIRCALIHGREPDRAGGAGRLRWKSTTDFGRDKLRNPRYGEKPARQGRGEASLLTQPRHLDARPLPSRPFAGTHEDGVPSSPHYRHNPNQCPGCWQCDEAISATMRSPVDIGASVTAGAVVTATPAKGGVKRGAAATPGSAESSSWGGRHHRSERQTTEALPAGHIVTSFPQLMLLCDILHGAYQVQAADIVDEAVDYFQKELASDLFFQASTQKVSLRACAVTRCCLDGPGEACTRGAVCGCETTCRRERQGCAREDNVNALGREDGGPDTLSLVV